MMRKYKPLMRQNIQKNVQGQTTSTGMDRKPGSQATGNNSATANTTRHLERQG